MGTWLLVQSGLYVSGEFGVREPAPDADRASCLAFQQSGTDLGGHTPPVHQHHSVRTPLLFEFVRALSSLSPLATLCDDFYNVLATLRPLYVAR